MSIRKEIARYEIQFIFEASEAIILDKSLDRSMKVKLDEIVTEENYRKEFEALVEALRHSGNARQSDSIVCTTFRTRAKRASAPGRV